MIVNRRRNYFPLPSPPPAAHKMERTLAKMAYGLNPRLFIENGPAIQAAGALARSSSVPFHAWKSFDRERRLALVEKALKVPANDDCDGYPIAL